MKVAKHVAGALALVVGWFAAGHSLAQEVKLVPQVYRIKDFKLQSGEVLPEMLVEYATLGEPKKDAAGNITNAVINAHGWSGNYAQTIKLAKDLAGAGKPLDPARFYLIFPTALGSPGSSSPSTSGLGAKFPTYTMSDMVAAQYRLVTEHLGVKHLAGVTGISMGGYQTMQWITQYPDMMDWAIPIATSSKADGRTIGIFGVMSYTIKSDPAYQGGRYTAQPKDAMRRAFMGTYLWYFGAEHYQAQYKTEADALKGLENAGLGSDTMDANDIVWRNNAMATYNVAGALSKVKAKVLVVGVDEDELFPPKLAEQPIADGIPGARAYYFSSPLGHIGSAVHVGRASAAINQFLASVGAK
jgi:homoserine O-acetyltransferase